VLKKFSYISWKNAIKELHNPKNINKKGKIINISSPGSTKVLNNYFSIGVSKAALESLTRYMAYDLAKDDISVNSISASPGAPP